ncbi:helix-turn-helix domain-containing protein [Vibrio viridaestus]
MSVFVKAAELGSFALTAESLNLSAKIVSKHIA